jgi:hypothetical protein
MHALDRRELRHALRREPIEEIRRGARIGAARVRIADIGGEEFNLETAVWFWREGENRALSRA